MPTSDPHRAQRRFARAIARFMLGLETQRARVLQRTASASRLIPESGREVIDLRDPATNDLDYYVYELGRLRAVAVQMLKAFDNPAPVRASLADFDTAVPQLRRARNPLGSGPFVDVDVEFVDTAVHLPEPAQLGDIQDHRATVPFVIGGAASEGGPLLDRGQVWSRGAQGAPAVDARSSGVEWSDVLSSRSCASQPVPPVRGVGRWPRPGNPSPAGGRRHPAAHAPRRRPSGAPDEVPWAGSYRGTWHRGALGQRPAMPAR